MRNKRTKRMRVLCVDDEPLVLDGLSLNLRRSFDVMSATSGKAGLIRLSEDGPFSVVVSDMRMPEMDGAAFLAKVREVAPTTVRLLLTGQTDLQSAIKAVNEGQVFRFLTKPCAPDQFMIAIRAAAEQHRLITAEQELLEKTLHGSIEALTDVLALTNPVAFGRASRIKQHVATLSERLGLRERWQVEVAAMLSQLGAITLPTETAEKLYFGQRLTEKEKEMVSRLPEVTERLLAHIPRLQPVLDLLASLQEGSSSGRKRNQKSSQAAEVLRIAVAFDKLEARGASTREAMDTLRGRGKVYDAAVLEAFAQGHQAEAAMRKMKGIPLQDVREGMILTEDLLTEAGTLLVARGYEVTASFVIRALSFRRGYVKEPVCVMVSDIDPGVSNN